jgi:hypothetical protein
METLMEANQSSSIFQSSLITVVEKMLHGIPNGSQSELVYLPILSSSQLAKRCSIETLMEPIRAHPSSDPPLITVGEKMLHGNPIGSQSELIYLPTLPSTQLVKMCLVQSQLDANQSSSIF